MISCLPIAKTHADQSFEQSYSKDKAVFDSLKVFSLLKQVENTAKTDVGKCVLQTLELGRERRFTRRFNRNATSHAIKTSANHQNRLRLV